MCFCMFAFGNCERFAACLDLVRCGCFFCCCWRCCLIVDSCDLFNLFTFIIFTTEVIEIIIKIIYLTVAVVVVVRLYEAINII